MNADLSVENLNRVTAAVIGAAQHVSSVLGCGFLEKVYENALRVELELRGWKVEQQKAVGIRYRDEIVGLYLADLVVQDRVIVELKAASALDRIHEAQCMNYLRATGHKICLLFNFGRPRLEVRRFVRGL
jgi:GxxExxY protein